MIVMVATSSIILLSDALVLGKIKKLRIEANPKRTKFGCTIDYSPTQYASTIEQACSKALAAFQKKSDSYGEKLIKETGTESLFGG
jgi:hypothetical protein